MTEFFITIQFEQVRWMLGIPVISILLAVMLWKQPLVLKTWLYTSQTGRKKTYYLPAGELLEDTGKKESTKANRPLFVSQYIRYLLFFTAICIALARPYHEGQKLPEPPLHRDIIFLVDTSVTMSLKDYQLAGHRVERMAMLKNVLDHFIKQLDGSRIGINIFSEQVYTLVPLTTDYQLLGIQLQRLESAVLTGRTSNPSQALLYTAKQFQENIKKPALVLLTDINRPDRKIDPRTVARYLSDQGFHLHIVGIGAGSKQAEDDDISDLIYQPANFHLLEEMATAGKGKFFWAKDNKSLNTALASIKQTEKRVIDLEPEYIKQPLYMWFILAALAWVSFWQLVPLVRVRA